MVEADIHLRPLYTSMLDTYNMFEPLVCSLKSIWVHPNTVTLANLAPDLGVQVYLRSGNDATTCHGWGWTTSYIHSRHIQCVWSISSMLSQGHMVVPLYHYTHQVSPRFGKAGSLEEWKWCLNVMVEADIHLRPLHTSMVDICKVFEPLVCCPKGIWVHPYTVTPAKSAPYLWSRVHLRSENDAITSCLRLISTSTSDHFIHSY